MIRHHPSEALLLRHAAGRLPPAHATVLDAHLARCGQCRVALGAAEAVGGALLQTLAPAALAPDALANTLARLDAPLDPLPAPGMADRVPDLIGAWPARPWRRIAPGIATLALSPRDATDTRLDMLRVAPGAGLLGHGHAGLETLVVLRGAFEDGVASYAEGDFAEADATLAHRPVALPGGPCICLFATTGHLKPHSLLGRLLRPLLGM